MPEWWRTHGTSCDRIVPDTGIWIAGYWVDVVSALGGVLYVLYVRRTPRRRGGKLISKDTGLDFFAGLALATLGLLFLAAFSSSIMARLLESSGITLAGASVLAILAILEESDG